MKIKQTDPVYVDELGKNFTSREACLDSDMNIILCENSSYNSYFVDDWNSCAIHDVASLRKFLKENEEFVRQVLEEV